MQKKKKRLILEKCQAFLNKNMAEIIPLGVLNKYNNKQSKEVSGIISYNNQKIDNKVKS